MIFIAMSEGVPADAGLHSIPYEEPSIVTLLTVGSFLLLLPVSRAVLDRLLYAGIIAYLVLGSAYGAPLGNILPDSLQYATQNLGYLGLLLLIACGGMETRLDILAQPRTLGIALLVATIGIALPIALSMGLCTAAFGYSGLQAFAMGAALSSTSLGTIFSVLESLKSGRGHADKEGSERANEGSSRSSIAGMPDLISTRVGTVLVGAALFDDIVALVISTVVQALGAQTSTSGGGAAGLAPWTVARPIVTSLLIILGSVLLGACVKTLASMRRRRKRPASRATQSRLATALLEVAPVAAPVAFIAVVFASAVVAHYIYSSVLIGAFCAGAFMRYSFDQIRDAESHDAPAWLLAYDPERAFSPIAPVQAYVLVPLFFASIGIAIPVRDLFDTQTAWRGIVYTLLMFAGKLAAGAVLLLADLARFSKARYAQRQPRKNAAKRDSDGTSAQELAALELQPPKGSPSEPAQSSGAISVASSASLSAGTQAERSPSSLPAALLLGLSLVARGEIGFIIISIARSSAILGAAGDARSLEAFNVAIWAIVGCTFLGPIIVGLLLKHTAMARKIAEGPWR